MHPSTSAAAGLETEQRFQTLFASKRLQRAAALRGQEAEAVRRAYNLRARGADMADFRAAVHDSSLKHAQVNRLQLELNRCVR